jgi:hypothetical protein
MEVFVLLTLLSFAFPFPESHLSAGVHAWPAVPALDLEARLEGDRDAYLLGAVRIEPGDAWLGRAGVGFDLLGGGTADVRLGLFLGGVGTFEAGAWGPEAHVARVAAGGEILLGLHLGRLHGSYRHLDGFAGPLEDRLTEDELRVGYRVVDPVEVYGRYIVWNPGERDPRGGFGLGVDVVF